MTTQRLAVWSYVSPIAVDSGADGILGALEMADQRFHPSTAQRAAS